MITARIDLSALRAAVGTATDGASETFFRVAGGKARQIVADARPMWPVRTGRSRDALSVSERIEETRLSVVIENDATPARGGKPYGYLVKWSRLTVAQVEQKIQAYGDKAKSPELRAAAIEYGRRIVYRRHGKGAPPGFTSLRPWDTLIAKPVKAHAPAVAAEVQTALARLRVT
jgi:hypothetical protein